MCDYLSREVTLFRYDTRKDFTVVLNPLLVQADLPRVHKRGGGKAGINIEYLAPDCFHWAQKTHAMGRLKITTRFC